MYFPISGVEASPLLPVGAAFFIALICSPAGISGAFLLLPFQISILGYTQPGVSATNQVFNILSCPAGIWRFAREGRFLLPLGVFMAIGTFPGVFIGAVLRLTWLSTLSRFTLFMACVFIYMSIRMLRQKGGGKKAPRGEVISAARASWKGLSFHFMERDYSISSRGIIILSLIVGIVGGIYGIGGGAILAPFLVTFFKLPVHAVSGACLFATFVTSVAAVAFFELLGFFWQLPRAAPDWLLGFMLGIGGMAGMYCGAALQKYLPGRVIRYFLIIFMLALACRYLCQAL